MVEKAEPICQAGDCDIIAKETIQSANGHPNNEWKLCTIHFNEVNGKDPRLAEIGWMPRKLYYRCSQCDEEVSHNTIQPKRTCPGCGNPIAAET